MDLFNGSCPLAFEAIEDAAKKLEACETPLWAAYAGLSCADLQTRIIDPCVGRGVLSNVARAAGHDVRSADVYPWEYEGERLLVDFLSPDAEALVDGWEPQSFDVFMNAPFTRACEFVDRAFELGARKVLNFHGIAWFGSKTRRSWWDGACCKNVHFCAERATWWYFHIAPEKRKGSNPKEHAWYEFERGYVGDPDFKRLYRDGAKNGVC